MKTILIATIASAAVVVVPSAHASSCGSTYYGGHRYAHTVDRGQATCGQARDALLWWSGNRPSGTDRSRPPGWGCFAALRAGSGIRAFQTVARCVQPADAIVPASDYEPADFQVMATLYDPNLPMYCGRLYQPTRGAGRGLEIWDIRALRTSCPTARRVAHKWYGDTPGVLGFRCHYRVDPNPKNEGGHSWCRRGRATVKYDWNLIPLP
jgi:hypothetical protein